MEKNNLLFGQILGVVILGLIYAYFLFMYTGFTPYTYGFTCLALFLSLFSALIFKSKTRLFKVINTIFFLYTLYQLFSYKADWDLFRQLDREDCSKENAVLQELKEEGIINLSYTYKYEEYNEDEGECILTFVQATDKNKEDGVIDGK